MLVQLCFFVGDCGRFSAFLMVVPHVVGCSYWPRGKERGGTTGEGEGGGGMEVGFCCVCLFFVVSRSCCLLIRRERRRRVLFSLVS